MYPVSDDFKVAVRYSHEIITKAEIIRDDQLVGVIYPEAGSVEIDARRAQRRTCSVSLHAGGRELVYTPVYNTYATFGTGYATYTALSAGVASYDDSQSVINFSVSTTDDGLIPDSGLDLLTPYGNELRLFRGISYRKQGIYSYAKMSTSYATYTTLNADVPTYGILQLQTGDIVTIDEYVPLGVFRITDVAISQDPSGIGLDITGIDRGYRIANNRWIEPYQIASGTNVKTALTSLLQDRYTDITLRFSDTTATTSSITLGLDTENDPWSDAQHIAETAGLDLYFDADGYCVLEQIKDSSVAASVEQYAENEEAMVLSTNRVLSSDGVYNAVIVTGEGSDMDTPFRASAIDDNPASPTYAYGPFGLVPTFRSSPLINSQASANAFAISTLNQIRGKDESLTWGQIVDPSLDAGDVVSIINVTAKIARAMVIDRLTIPLGSEESMSAQGRTIVYSTGDAVVTAGGETVAVIPQSSGADEVLAPGGIVRIQSSSPEGIIRIRSIQ